MDRLSQEFDDVIRDVPFNDLHSASTALWESVHHHPDTASCECPVVDALAALYERGYRLVKGEGQVE